MKPAADIATVWVAIPVYNNAGTIRRVALECQAIVPNVLVLDDGSRDGNVQELLAGTGILVIRHEVNRGKGQALLTAARAIQERNGTTMITVDGDGQHFPTDLHAFLPLIAKNPDAIILGERDMSGENVPESSRFGRKFSDFWLRLETGRDLRDTQSGFRAYPVEHLLKLGCAGRKYDFEVEVLARGAWAGLPILSVPIKVWYPPAAERISSFRPFMDNLWLTHRHVLLVLRRLLPWGHKQLVDPPQEAPVKLRGNSPGILCFILALRLTGLRGAYGFLFIVCTWYALVDSSIIRAARAYIQRRFPEHGWLRQRWDIYQLFIAQGRCLIDRYYLVNGGDQLRFSKRGFDLITPLLESPSGLLLLTAHVGNWQIAMTSLEGWNKPVHMLMRPNQHPTREKHLKIYQFADRCQVINPDSPLGGVLEIMKALENGDMVSIMGDRDYSSNNSKKVAVRFLNDSAQFPTSSFLFAHATGLPLAVLLSAKTGPYDYEVQIAGIIQPRPGEPKNQFIQRGVQEYAGILEEYLQQHPLQCFLFQDIWSGHQPVTA